jgi:thiosulfate/3-mercaptopyruvate sulfurtransferase
VSIISEQPLPSAEPVLSADALLALRENIGDKLVILDASVPPVVPGYESLNDHSPAADWQIIPGARRFDYDSVFCDPNAALPHMMPSAERFEREARALGLSQDSVIVVYDDAGLYASPRAWWMLKAMGHEQVAVLSGGLRAWLDAGQDAQTAGAQWRAGMQVDGEPYGLGNFAAKPQREAFINSAEVLAALNDARSKIIDARSAARFLAQAPEPRPGVRGGHMPGSLNLPFPAVLNGSELKPRAELETLFAELAAKDERVITSCGSGLTACVLTLAAYAAGYRKLSVYDGSWADWGSDATLPVVEQTSP